MTTRTERATERAAAKAEGRLTYTEAETDRNAPVSSGHTQDTPAAVVVSGEERTDEDG